MSCYPPPPPSDVNFNYPQVEVALTPTGSWSLPQVAVAECEPEPEAEPEVWGLLPRRKPLLTRCSRRCLRDLANGKAGILVKPKADPLEGDSSSIHKTKVGEWWKKMSSATQVRLSGLSRV